jgi:hypothetical protein
MPSPVDTPPNHRKLLALIVAGAAGGLFLWGVLYDPPAPEGTTGTPLDAADLLSWENHSLDAALQYGLLTAAAWGDADGDGKDELAVAGTYASGYAEVRLFRIADGALEEAASLLWNEPSWWRIESVAFADIDALQGSEIILGGDVHFGTDEGAPGFLAFRFREGHLEYVGGSWWGVGEGAGTVAGISPPSSEDGSVIQFVTLSRQFSDAGGGRADLKGWT